MSYLEKYVLWLKDENQALYDELARKEKEIENLRKKIRKYEYQEGLIKEMELLKEKADAYDRLSDYFNVCQEFFDA